MIYHIWFMVKRAQLVWALDSYNTDHQINSFWRELLTLLEKDFDVNIGNTANFVSFAKNPNRFNWMASEDR